MTEASKGSYTVEPDDHAGTEQEGSEVQRPLLVMLPYVCLRRQRGHQTGLQGVWPEGDL